VADHVKRACEDWAVVVASPCDGELDTRRVLGEWAIDRAVHGHVLHRCRDERDPEPRGDKADERRGLGDFMRGSRFEAVGRAGILDGVMEDGSEV
jgi:hypothetical protein